jgi:hypothetical protein
MTEAQEVHCKLFQQGRYTGLYGANKSLYELLLLATKEGGKRLVVNFDAKPNDVMLYTRAFRLHGIQFDTFNDGDIGPFIKICYRAIINPSTFIGNLTKFDNVASSDIINTVNKRQQSEKADKRRKEIARIKASGNVNSGFPGSIGKIPIR